MTGSGRGLNGRLQALAPLVGSWELTATQNGQRMSVSPVSFRWDDRGAFLHQRSEPHTFLIEQWVGAAPAWADAVYGADDHTGALTMLYADARGTSRVGPVTLVDGRWTIATRPAEDFHQRFEGLVTADRIDGRWLRSSDGETWETDFEVTYRRTG